uniref:Uncharacterized protein n=1 Tax=Strongyloides stercoralis TaxID=6248 RepID=A0AAF5DEZ8_STRER
KVLSHQNNYHNLEKNFENIVQYLKNETNYKECQYKNFSPTAIYPKLKVSNRYSKCNKIDKNIFFDFSNNTFKYKQNHPNISCKYRCMYPNGDTKVKYSKWRSIKNAHPNCDIFEVICKHPITNEAVFYDVFLQFYKLSIKSEKNVDFLKSSYSIDKVKHKYNVHLIVIDSISHFNALRGFSETLKYLKYNYKGVNFKYLNKIGYGSKPNGFGFLLNKRTVNLYDFETDNYIPSDYDKTSYPCYEYLDSQPFIGKYYRQLNYTILMNDDSYESVFTMNNCKGFKENIFHHTSRPFLNKLKKLHFDPKYERGRVIKGKCLNNPTYQLDYLKSFMEAYKDRRQFTLTWLAKFSHDDITGHYQFDNLIKNFFEKNKNLFDNGFLIFMGDHGFKMGTYRGTNLGDYEDRNPFLLIAPPKALRNEDGEVYQNLLFNSNKHISQFDIYATMFDIATESSRNDFSKMTNFDFNSIIKNDQIKGLSLLRKIAKSRSCLEMEVTSQFCLCYNYPHTLNNPKLKKLEEKSSNKNGNFFNINSLINLIKMKFVNHLNNLIKMTKSRNLCAKIKESKNGLFDIKYFLSKNKTIIFFVRQEVKPRGLYEAYFNEKGDLLNSTMIRVDQYNNSINNKKTCEIREYSIKSNYSEFFHPFKSPKCKKTFSNNFLQFKKGILKYSKENFLKNCKYRCSTQVSDTKFQIDEWNDINNAKPKCDVFEVNCYDKNSKKIIFQDLLLQLKGKNSFKKEKATFIIDSYPLNELNNKYSVHIIVLDSISQYNIERGFVKTLNYLKKAYNAINFKYLNKVATNSQPNAHSFLMNRRVMPLINMVNGKVIPSDYEKIGKSYCNEYLDDEPYIVKYYRQLDYKILIGEDGEDSVFSWQKCKGFNTSYAHHTTRPYMYHLRSKRKNIYISNFHKKCFKLHIIHLNYLSTFLKTYKDSKTFSLTWLSSISHSQITGHYQYDKYFKKYFQKNKEYFDNSFLFIMADHGYKMGNYRFTDIGDYEDKNPFLIISIPADLRDQNNEIIENMKYNSDKHISHYDIYATLLDIATEGGRSNFKNLKQFDLNTIIKNDKIKGLSLLRKIEISRNCFEMEISGNLNNICVPFNIKEGDNGKIFFWVRQEVLPKGVFETYFYDNGEIVTTHHLRIDPYKKYTQPCVGPGVYEKYCYCKSLVEKKNTIRYIN